MFLHKKRFKIEHCFCNLQVVRLKRDEEIWDLLSTLLQEFGQISCDRHVPLVEEGCCQASVADASCTANAVNIFVNTVRHIIVDNVHNLFDVDATGNNSCGDQNWAVSGLERKESIFTFHL